MLVPRTRRFFITTDSKHFFHKSPNLIKNLTVTNADQAFVTDITYINLQNSHAYLTLVTNLYSKEIMRYCLYNNMKVGLVKEVLQMVVNIRQYSQKNIINQSDKGIQYCCPDYSEFT